MRLSIPRQHFLHELRGWDVTIFYEGGSVSGRSRDKHALIRELNARIEGKRLTGIKTTEVFYLDDEDAD